MPQPQKDLSYNVLIYDVQWDEVCPRHFSDSWYGPGEGEDYEFWWSDGNFSCDCNRALQCGYSRGLDYGEIPTFCGERWYRILSIITSDGEYVYWEEDPRYGERED